MLRVSLAALIVSAARVICRSPYGRGLIEWGYGGSQWGCGGLEQARLASRGCGPRRAEAADQIDAD